MKRFFNDAMKYRRYVVHSAKSQLKSEVADSYLNWVWWILDPICFMLIYTFIFGVVFDGREQYFPVYIFVGITAWNFFNKCVLSSVRMVKTNKSIIDKVYVPKFILAFTRMGVDGFKMLISLAIVAGMMIIYRVPVTLNILYAVPLVLLLMLVTFATMTILMHLGVFVEDMSNIVNILLRLVFYITGIFYSVTKRLPSPLGDYVLKLNPLAYILDGLRKCLLYGQAPSLKVMVMWFVLSLAVSAIGIKIIYKYENGYVKVI